MRLFLSPSLSVSLSSVLFPFCFSHSLYLSTPSHPHPRPPQPCLFLQAWSFPGHKFPSFQPYGSLTLHNASFSLLFSHCLCHPLSKTPSFLAVMYLLLAVSVPLPLPCLPSQCLLAPIMVSPSDSAHLSPIFSPLSSPDSLSPWEPSPPTETAPGQLCPKSVVSQSSHPR